MVSHENRAHALLSASGASRWLNCPPSARVEDTYPEQSSVYAAEGTVAHEICDISLKLHLKQIKKVEYNKQLKELQKHSLYSKEMLDYADDYVAYVVSLMDKDSEVWVETRLDFSEYVPDGFGTGDALVINTDEIHVVDFKYGKGIAVSSDNNSQMKLYGLGAISMLESIYDFSKVSMHIYQPRINNVVSTTEDVETLLLWGEGVVKPTALQAYEGEGEHKAGDHCTFCKHSSKCKTMFDYATSVISEEFEDESGKLSVECITPDDVAMILSKTKLIKNWLTSVENYAIENIYNGSLDVPGYKVVEGRSNRVYVDPDKVVEVLKTNGFEEALLYEKKLLTITNMEKLVGKKDFNVLLEGLIDKPQGKPTVVVETDKRSVMTMLNEFEDEREEEN